MTTPASTPASPVNVVLAGLGALGTKFIRATHADPRITIVGAVDIDPAKIGKTITEVTGEPVESTVPVAGDLATLLATVPVTPTVYVHATESRPATITPVMLEAIEAGLNVLSAAESMFYPQLRYPEQAAQLDAAAKKAGVTVSGTGINPGFTFDQLVMDVAAATTDISSLRLDRAVVVADTGPGDVEHVGFGLPLEEFNARITAGTVEGHMGLPESFVLLAERLDMPINRISESWEAVTSEEIVPSNIGDIHPGHVVGIVQHAHAYLDHVLVMSARLAMYYSEGIEEEADEIELNGLHHMNMRMAPSAVSIQGAGIVMANVVPLLPGAPAGLVNVMDLPTRAARSTAHYTYDPSSVPGAITLIAGTVGL